MANIEQKRNFASIVNLEANQKFIANTLGDKRVAQQFTADITSVVVNNPALSDCNAKSIIAAGLAAQSMKLPLSQALGYAYVIPYGDKAQFQISYRGWILLAQRSGQYENIGARAVHEGEYIGQNEFGDDIFKFSHDCDGNKVVGYYAFFVLLNGFKKTIYWTAEQIERHAKKYSKTYAKYGTGLWKDEKETMALKTVLKQLISKWGVTSIELQNAIQSDQAIFTGEGSDYTYADNANAYSALATETDTSTKKKSTVKNKLSQEENSELVVEQEIDATATPSEDEAFFD